MWPRSTQLSSAQLRALGRTLCGSLSGGRGTGEAEEVRALEEGGREREMRGRCGGAEGGPRVPARGETHSHSLTLQDVTVTWPTVWEHR